MYVYIYADARRSNQYQINNTGSAFGGKKIAFLNNKIYSRHFVQNRVGDGCEFSAVSLVVL